MKRSIRGLILLASLAVLAACDAEPKAVSEPRPSPRNEVARPAPNAENAVLPALAQDGAWGTLKGQVVWAGPMPQKIMLNVKVNANGPACLANGPIFEQDLVVNDKNKGVKWVFAWLAPATGEAYDPVTPVHPKIDLKAIKSTPVMLDQPLCMFAPRALAILEGQQVVVKNPADFLHNIKWTGNPDINPGGNQGIPPGMSYTIKDLQAQKLPLVLECSVHGWMKARLGVFSHPYFAVTDADGNFEIKDAPAGKFRLFVYQESIRWRNGREGSKGEPIEIKAGVNNLGTLDLK